jgi:hypothetical protein
MMITDFPESVPRRSPQYPVRRQSPSESSVTSQVLLNGEAFIVAAGPGIGKE